MKEENLFAKKIEQNRKNFIEQAKNNKVKNLLEKIKAEDKTAPKINDVSENNDIEENKVSLIASEPTNVNAPQIDYENNDLPKRSQQEGVTNTEKQDKNLQNQEQSSSKKQHKKSNVKKIIAGLLLIILLAGFYFGGAYFFKNHYIFGTKVNGVDISLKTKEAASDAITQNNNDQTLQVHFEGEKILKINKKDSGYNFDMSNVREKLLAQQNPWLWFIPRTKNIDITSQVSFDHQIFAQNYLNKINKMVPNVDLNKIVKYNPQLNKYEVNEKEYKEHFLINNIVEQIKNSLINNETKVVIVKSTQVDEKIATLLDKVNKIIKKDIPISFGQINDTLDAIYIHELIMFKDNKIEIDANKLGSTLQYIAKTHQKIANGKVYTYNGLKLLTQVKSDLEKFKINSYKAQENVIPLGKNNGQGTLKLGGSYIEVNISAQKMYVWKNSKLVNTFNVITGDHSKGRDTPIGVWTIWNKEMNKTLSGNTVGVGADYDYKIPVKYWMAIDDTGVGLHSIDPDEVSGSHGRVNWNPNSYLVGHGSHGCVNMHTPDAAFIYNNFPLETKVYVTP